MLTLQEKIKNLQTILSNQSNLTPENKQILSKEIERLEGLVKQEKKSC